MASTKQEPVPAQRDIAYRVLKGDIVACRIPPGQWITVRGLADQTGLGNSPIRDALTRLDHEGLVRTIPRKGYQVRPLTIKSIDDLFAFWGIILPEICRRGIAGASTEQIERAMALFDQQAVPASDNAAPPDGNRPLGPVLDAAFAILANATANEYLIETFHRLTGEISRVWALVFAVSPAETEYLSATVADLLEVLAVRDGEGAADIVAKYIHETHDRCLRKLARWPSIVTSELSLPQHINHSASI